MANVKTTGSWVGLKEFTFLKLRMHILYNQRITGPRFHGNLHGLIFLTSSRVVGDFQQP